MTENSTCGGNETKHTDLEFQQEASQGQPRPEESFTVFSPGENRLLTYLIGTAMLFSPLSANIYFPSIVVLEKAYHKSTQLINLTVTAYIVVQGISPALLGSVADSLGRRPVFLASFTIYFFANLGLALQSNYAALLVLRMVQSFGCSAHNAISYGVIADVSTPDKRGRMLGPAMVATNLGPILAPVLGGLIVNRASWRWLFWFLLIAGGVFLAILIITLPETARSIVGNGSRLPPKLYRPIISLVGLRQIPKRALSTSESHSILSDLPKPQIPNPLHSLRILAYPDAAFVLSITGTYYTVYYCLQTSMSRSFEQVYKFNELFAGLGYLGIGLGVALGGYLNGRLMDHNYKAKAELIGHSIDRHRGDNLRTFPIEESRLRFMPYWILTCTAFFIGYGWTIYYHVHVSVAIILQWGLGFISTVIVQTCNTLLVDMFVEQPSTAAAAGNLVRCGMAAGGVAAMQPLMDRMGIGWFFTLVGIASGVGGLISHRIVVDRGMKWRQRRYNMAS